MRWLSGMLVLLLAIGGTAAVADSWTLPERTEYLSNDNAVRLTIIPRPIRDRLTYFTDVDGLVPAGQSAGATQRTARGLLERRSGERWRVIWDVPFVNDVAPVFALVANGGAFVVTFDNWHSVGLGPNVVVIYRGDGSIVRSLALADILPEDYVRALPRSVSSLWWGGKHELSGDNEVILKVVTPSATPNARTVAFVNVTVKLETGTIVPPAGTDWDTALAKARPIAARSRATEALQRARFISPLVAPEGELTFDWQRYLAQASDRLIPEGAAAYGPTWVLPAPSAPDHAEMVRDIREAIGEAEAGSTLAFAGPAAPDALVSVLREAAAAVQPGALKGVNILVVVSESYIEAARAALAPTGANSTVVGSAEPIHQRPERLRELGLAAANVEAEASRLREEARQLNVEATAFEAQLPPEPISRSADPDGLEEMTDRLEEMADKLEDEADAAERDLPPH